jgi:hypothetical protein
LVALLQTLPFVQQTKFAPFVCGLYRWHPYFYLFYIFTTAVPLQEELTEEEQLQLQQLQQLLQRALLLQLPMNPLIRVIQ